MVTYLVYTVFLSTAGLAILVANALVVLCVLCFQHIRVSCSSHYIVSLAATDLLLGLITFLQGVSGFTVSTFIQSHDWCLAVRTIVLGCVFSSQIHMCLIAFDRYLYIMKPLQYIRLMTIMRVRLAISVTWIASALYGSSVFLHHNYEHQCIILVTPLSEKVIASLVTFCVCLIVSASLYYAITRKALEQRKRISSTNKNSSWLSLAPTTSFNGESSSMANQMSSSGVFAFIPRTSLRKLKHTMKILKMFSLVIGLFFAFWSPITIAEVVLKGQKPNEQMVRRVCLLFAICHSFVNVLVYACYDKSFKKALREILCYGCRKMIPRSKSERKERSRHCIRSSMMESSGVGYQSGYSLPPTSKRWMCRSEDASRSWATSIDLFLSVPTEDNPRLQSASCCGSDMAEVEEGRLPSRVSSAISRALLGKKKSNKKRNHKHTTFHSDTKINYFSSEANVDTLFPRVISETLRHKTSPRAKEEAATVGSETGSVEHQTRSAERLSTCGKKKKPAVPDVYHSTKHRPGASSEDERQTQTTELQHIQIMTLTQATASPDIDITGNESTIGSRPDVVTTSDEHSDRQESGSCLQGKEVNTAASGSAPGKADASVT